MHDTSTLLPSAEFNLDTVIYSHAISPTASHLLVACATQEDSIRLVDLRSGALTQKIGSGNPILSVAWSPRNEYQLASAGVEGRVRIWDVRRSRGSVGTLDLRDDVGVSGFTTGENLFDHGVAHNGLANGVVWTEDASHIVSAGHDEKIRVWDMKTGANTLTAFGPLIRNNHLSTLQPLLVPSELSPSGKEIMFWPNPTDILGFELFDGKMIKRMKTWSNTSAKRNAVQQMNAQSRTTALAWKSGDVGMYSAHTDGSIKAWLPRTKEAMEEDEGEEAERMQNDPEEINRKRKRDALDDVYRNLTQRPITFT
jgi:DNA excision repair protein ERCC-8